MNNIKLKYGKSVIGFDIDNAKSIKYLSENEMEVIENLKETFINSITNNTINSKPLKELVSKDDEITIIISDLTRFWMRQDYICSYLVEYLNSELNIDFSKIKVLIALGTHKLNTDEEKKTLAGEFAFNNVEVLDHDYEATNLVHVGTTSFGTKVSVNPLALNRKVICIGGTVHHIMAGYGGGRKSIVPGISSKETIVMNHQLALDPDEFMSNVKIGSGKMKENPINLDMCEAADFVPVTFGINIVVDAHSKHSGLFCGNFIDAWKESCKYVQKSYGKPIQYEADVVIASCGGYPKDISLYQTMKTFFNAVTAVKKDGILILVTQCVDGGGTSDFFDWQKSLAKGTLEEDLRADFTIGGYIFFAACESAKKAKTYLVTEIDPTLVSDMGFEAKNNIEDILNKIDFSNKDVYIIEHGGSVAPQLEENYQFLCNDI